MQCMWQVINTIQLVYLVQLFSFDYPPVVVFFIKPFDSVVANVPFLADFVQGVLD